MPDRFESLKNKYSYFFERDGYIELFDDFGGWYNIVEWLLRSFALLNKRLQISLIKEKWGSLRIYHNSQDKDVEALIQMAEEKSARTCIQCGKHGEIIEGVEYLCPLCPEHARG